MVDHLSGHAAVDADVLAGNLCFLMLQKYALFETEPRGGNLSVAVGDAVSPTTPYGVAHRAQQHSGKPLNMNLLRRFETARGHPFLLQRCIPCWDESLPHQCSDGTFEKMLIFAD